MDVYDYLAFDFSVVTVKDNVIADPAILRRRKDGEKGWDPYYLNIDMQKGYELFKAGDPAMKKLFKGNLLSEKDPGFKDLKNGNLQLRDDAPAYRLGFKRIPMEMVMGMLWLGPLARVLFQTYLEMLTLFLAARS